MSYSDRKEGNWDYQRVSGQLKAQEKAQKEAIKAAEKAAKQAAKSSKKRSSYNSAPKNLTVDQVMADYNSWNAKQPQTAEQIMADFNAWNTDADAWMKSQTPVQTSAQGSSRRVVPMDTFTPFNQGKQDKKEEQGATRIHFDPTKQERPDPSAITKGGIPELGVTDSSSAYSQVMDYKEKRRKVEEDKAAQGERHAKVKEERLAKNREKAADIIAKEDKRYHAVDPKRPFANYSDAELNAAVATIDPLRTSMSARETGRVNALEKELQTRKLEKNRAEFIGGPGSYDKPDLSNLDQEELARQIVQRRNGGQNETPESVNESLDGFTKGLYALDAGAVDPIIKPAAQLDKAIANATGTDSAVERAAKLDPTYTTMQIAANNARNREDYDEAQRLENTLAKRRENLDVEKGLEQAADQNGLAYGAGKLATIIGENILLGNLLEGAGWVANTGNKALDFAANQGIKLIPDLATDTLPEVIDAYSNGERGLELAGTAAKNAAINAAFNIGTDAVGALIPYLKKLRSPADDAAKAANLSPLETAAKDTGVVDDIAEQATKQAPIEPVKPIAPEASTAEEVIEQAAKTDVATNGLRYPEQDNPIIDSIETARKGMEEGIPKATSQLDTHQMQVDNVLSKYDFNANEETKVLLDAVQDDYKTYRKVIQVGDTEAADAAAKKLRSDLGKLHRRAEKYVPDYKGELNIRDITQGSNYPAYSIRNMKNAKIDADSVMNNWNNSFLASEFGDMTREQYDTFLKEAQDLGWVDELGNPTKEALGSIPSSEYDDILSQYDDIVKNALEQGNTEIDTAASILDSLEKEQKAGRVYLDDKEWYDMVGAANEYARTGEKQYLEQMNDIVSAKHAENIPAESANNFTKESFDANDQTRISSARTNSYERLGYGKNMPEEDYRYKVYSEESQKADAIERYSGNENVARTIINKDIKDVDEADIKAAFSEMQRLMDKGDPESLRLANMLGQKTAAAQRQGGRVVQASAEFTRNTAAGALRDAANAQEGIINAWKGRNLKAYEGNKRLANALASMGNTEKAVKNATAQTFEEIKQGVKKELEKEFGSIYDQFNDADIDYIANLIENGITKDELANALNMKLATGSFGISDETLKAVNNIFNEIKQYNPDSKMFMEGQDRAYKLLADELLPNATSREKFEAWRYLAMLGNPKTMLRNKVGNDTFNVVTGLSNNIAAMAEAGIDKAVKAAGGEGIQRTKSVLNPISDGALIKAAGNDADVSSYRQLIGSKYEKMSRDTLRQHKSVFKSKLAQGYEKLVDAGISDYKAAKRKYATSLAGYLKANGYGEDIFKAEDELRALMDIGDIRVLSAAEKAQMEALQEDIEALNKAREYAIKQAEYATFHEDNKIAQILTKWSRTSKEEGTGLGHLMIEGMVPFKKTPANVLRSGIEYSPLGAIDSIKKTGKLIYENTGKRAGNLASTYLNKKGKEVAKTLASDVIESWSKTLTGTGLAALGFYLYNKGIIHVSDPDTQYQDQLEGHQNYAIEINGHSYTIDWAAPSIMPLMVGAECAKIWDSTGKGDEDFLDNIDEYFTAANSIVDPLIETSMLSGVRNSIDAAATAAQSNEAIDIPLSLMYNLGTGYLSQGIPTLMGQVARTVDPTRRSTYTDKKGVAGVLDKQAKKMMNKIPGLSMLNEEYVDTYGRTQNNSPTDNPLLNLGYQMLSPGYYSKVNETDADRVSREAYDVNKETSTLPKWQSKYEIDGKRVDSETYTRYAKVYGEAQMDIRNTLSNNQWFNELDDVDKAAVVSQVNSLANSIAKAEMGQEVSGKYTKIYQKFGSDGLIAYMQAKSDMDGSTSNYAKVNALMNLDEEKRADMLPYLIDLETNGKTNTNGKFVKKYGANALIEFLDNGYKATGRNELPKTKDEAYDAALMYPASKQREMYDEYISRIHYSQTAKTTQGEEEAFQQGGMKALGAYVEREGIMKQHGGEYDDYAKSIEQEGGIPALEQYGRDLQGLEPYGLNTGGVHKVYSHAKSAYPEMGYGDFANLFTYVDSLGNSKGEGKNNRNLSQEEICAAMTANPEKAEMLQNMFWTSDKKVPVLKNGKYVPAKKK